MKRTLLPTMDYIISLETVSNLIYPEALQAMEQFVEVCKVVCVDAGRLIHSLAVLATERFDDLINLQTTCTKLDAYRAAIDA